LTDIMKSTTFRGTLTGKLMFQIPVNPVIVAVLCFPHAHEGRSTGPRRRARVQWALAQTAKSNLREMKETKKFEHSKMQRGCQGSYYQLVNAFGMMFVAQSLRSVFSEHKSSNSNSQTFSVESKSKTDSIKKIVKTTLTQSVNWSTNLNKPGKKHSNES